MEEYQYHIFAPYRVCPLGAHVDHQHGLVTGFAIDKGVDLWFSPSTQPEGHVHLESKTFEGVVDFEIDAPTQVKEGHWGDYARGAKYALRKRFELKRGITGVIQGSLPVGGLSSSAAVLIAYVMAFAKANEITLQPFEVVKIASEAEREYIGLNNGLLDQRRASHWAGRTGCCSWIATRTIGASSSGTRRCRRLRSVSSSPVLREVW